MNQNVFEALLPPFRKGVYGTLLIYGGVSFCRYIDYSVNGIIVVS